MEVHLTEDQRAFVRQAMQAGRFVAEEDALQEALLAAFVFHRKLSVAEDPSKGAKVAAPERGHGAIRQSQWQ